MYVILDSWYLGILVSENLYNNWYAQAWLNKEKLHWENVTIAFDFFCGGTRYALRLNSLLPRLWIIKLCPNIWAILLFWVWPFWWTGHNHWHLGDKTTIFKISAKDRYVLHHYIIQKPILLFWNTCTNVYRWNVTLSLRYAKFW